MNTQITDIQFDSTSDGNISITFWRSDGNFRRYFRKHHSRNFFKFMEIASNLQYYKGWKSYPAFMSTFLGRPR